MQKLKEVFDSKATWVALSVAAGALGEHYGAIVNAFGALVMAIL